MSIRKVRFYQCKALARCCSKESTINQQNDAIHHKSTFARRLCASFLRCEIIAHVQYELQNCLKQPTNTTKTCFMKKVCFYLFAVLALFTLATSCKKDKQEAPTVDPPKTEIPDAFVG